MKSEKMVDGYATDALNLMIILLTPIFVVDNIIFFLLLRSLSFSLSYYKVKSRHWSMLSRATCASIQAFNRSTMYQFAI